LPTLKQHEEIYQVIAGLATLMEQRVAKRLIAKSALSKYSEKPARRQYPFSKPY
jgi:hypothetical protein